MVLNVHMHTCTVYTTTNKRINDELLSTSSSSQISNYSLSIIHVYIQRNTSRQRERITLFYSKKIKAWKGAIIQLSLAQIVVEAGAVFMLPFTKEHAGIREIKKPKMSALFALKTKISIFLKKHFKPNKWLPQCAYNIIYLWWMKRCGQTRLFL